MTVPEEEVRYERLRPAELRARQGATPLLWFPVGVLEWHGEHNPYGLDFLKAHALCVRAARVAGGVVLPPVWTGTGGLTAGLGGSMAVRPTTWRLLLEDLFAEFEAQGWKACVALSGHYPSDARPETHKRILKEVAHAFMLDHGLRIWALSENELAADAGYPGDHAAWGETSLLMALEPELVDLSRLGDRPREELVGVYGEDPRTATPEAGARLVGVLVERLARGARALLEGEMPERRYDDHGTPQPEIPYR
jgi:creatinine amidohydrolase